MLLKKHIEVLHAGTINLNSWALKTVSMLSSVPAQLPFIHPAGREQSEPQG